jgi:hypothetical protein
MSSSLVTFDRESVVDSFREWQQEQSLLDAQLTESVEALDAYQAHLDNWQRELAREREEVRRLRETSAGDANDSAQREQIDQLTNELNDSRAKIGSLTAALLARTEEVRELERQREGAGTELALARAREQELVALLAAQGPAGEIRHHTGDDPVNHDTDAFSKAVDQVTTEDAGDSGNAGRPKVEPRRGASPVLGSVMEQFGKLREQRSLNRSNNKTR